MKTILTPVDFSATTSPMLDAAAALAADLNAELVLFNAVVLPIMTTEYGLVVENVSQLVEVSQKASARQLTLLVDKLTAKGSRARSQQMIGSAVESIIATAKELKADYIVMGSHGHTALYDLLVGGTTHGVLKKAPCPVVIVPSKEE
jgi:nucleotide-binding universal stress UspA family protein